MRGHPPCSSWWRSTHTPSSLKPSRSSDCTSLASLQYSQLAQGPFPSCILMLIPSTLSFSPELLSIYIDLKHLKCEHVLVKHYIMCFRISNPNSCHNNLLLKGILLSPFHSWKTDSLVSYKVGESLDSTLGNWIQSPCLFKNIIYIYLFILGSAGSSLLCELVSSCSKRGCSPAVRGLLIAVSSVVKEHGL